MGLLWQDNRHAVVYGGHQCVGFGRDDGAGVEFGTFGGCPGFPQARKTEWPVGFEGDVHRHFGFAIVLPLPFIEPRGGHDAAPASESTPE